MINVLALAFLNNLDLLLHLLLIFGGDGSVFGTGGQKLPRLVNPHLLGNLEFFDYGELFFAHGAEIDVLEGFVEHQLLGETPDCLEAQH